MGPHETASPRTSLVAVPAGLHYTTPCATAEACVNAGLAHARQAETTQSLYDAWMFHRLFLKAAELGHRGAQIDIVGQYEEGFLLVTIPSKRMKHLRAWVKDAKKAAYWRERALVGLQQDAERGDVDALLWQHTLYEGRIRLAGLFGRIEPDTALANQSLRRAAATGDMRALYRMGIAAGRSGDQEKALEYFEQAAEKGNYIAYLQWALHYISEYPQDYARYYEIRTRALEHRVPGAAWDVREMLDQVETWAAEGDSLAEFYRPFLEKHRWAERLAQIDMDAESEPNFALYF